MNQKSTSLQLFLLLLMCVSRVSLADQETPVVSNPGMDEYIKEREEYYKTVGVIEKLIKEGKLVAAEQMIKKYEPKYALKWSVGRFGFDTRIQIGQAYLEKGNKKEALRLFKAARPGGGCGNCIAAQHISKSIRVARIYDSRLNFPASFLTYINALPSTRLGGGLGRILWGLIYSGSVTFIPVLILIVVVRSIRRRQKMKVAKAGS